jgi:flavin reductase (DIM6/NTAB) family NADH-FMN oxidoreductase RutF
MSATAMLDPEVTEHGFRATMGLFASGVTIITVSVDGQAHGMTASAVMSVSLDPPLLAVAIDNGGHTRQLLERAGQFGVNVLAEGQSELALSFAERGRHGPELFGPGPVELGPAGDPLIPGSLTQLACTIKAGYPEGDHTLFVGRVTALSRPRITADPLIFYRGHFSVTACRSCLVRTDPTLAYMTLHDT